MLKRLQQWKMFQTIKKHRDKNNLVMGVTCYRAEQWHRLREISEDKENFDKTYEESRLDSENKITQLEAQGIRPVKVEVDVEEMLTWCTTQGLSVTPEARTKFIMSKLRELVNNGTVKPVQDTRETPTQILDENAINALFKKFSSPMVQSCTSDSDREMARGIARMLWMLLVSNMDSEKHMYNTLSEMFYNRPKDNRPVISLYFSKMKRALTRKEQLQLRRYYSDKDNFRTIKDWDFAD